jgi:Domain of unknown function (DUF4190)
MSPPPPGGAPPPGYPPNHGSAGSGRNGLAVASLVLGIVSIPMCFLFLPALLAVVFGGIALAQISSNPGQAGRGQAIAGLVLGGLSLALIILAIIVAGDATFEFDTSSLLLHSWSR